MAEAKAQPSFGGQLAGIANALKRGDIALALGVTAILVVLILPLPAWLLDLSLAMSITLSVLILMTVIFITKPLDFNSFPTILLIATMLRRSEEHTSELQSLMRISYAVFCLKKKKKNIKD